MSNNRQTQLMENAAGRGPERHIFQLLSTTGKPTGTTAMNHTAARDYYIRPDANETYVLRRLTVWEVDGSFTNAAGYGAGAALTNGIGITVENPDGVIKNYTPVTIKTTYEWGLLAGIDSTSIGGAGADPHLVRWTFGKGGGNITLDGSKGEFLKVSCGDAMNFLTAARMMVQGYIK
jgi:hypothetical protein